MGILSPSLLQDVQNSAINSGANFLTGATTSAFGPTIKLASNAAGIAGGALQTASVAANVSMQAVSYLQTQLISYTTEVALEIAKINMDDIPSKIISYVSYFMSTPAEIMKELSSPIEELQKVDNQKALKKKQDELFEKANEKVSKFTEPVNKHIEKASDALGSVSDFVQQGPQFVEKEINKIVNKTMDYAHKVGAKKVNEANELKQKTKDDIAKKTAKPQADEANNKLKQETKTKLEKMAEQKAKAINWAKAQADAAIKKIKAMLGA